MTDNDVCHVAPDFFTLSGTNIMLGRETWLMFSEETCQAHFELGKTEMAPDLG